MELLSSIAEIIRDLLIFVAMMTALLIALIIVVSMMPDNNPLKRLLTALTYRVGATAAAAPSPYRSNLVPASMYCTILRSRFCLSGIGSHSSETRAA